jgi:hypothetical protein
MLGVVVCPLSMLIWFVAGEKRRRVVAKGDINAVCQTWFVDFVPFTGFYGSHSLDYDHA